MKTMLRYMLIVAVLLACAAGATAAQHVSLTIEAADGAVLIRGELDTVAAIQSALEQHEGVSLTTEQVREQIEKSFAGSNISLHTFYEAGAAGQGVQRAELPLRRALLLGLVPPVEGLSQDTAAAVLMAAGLRHVTREQWDALPRRERLALAARSAEPLVVLAGTRPHDPAIIIYLQDQAEPTKNEPAGEN